MRDRGREREKVRKGEIARGRVKKERKRTNGENV